MVPASQWYVVNLLRLVLKSRVSNISWGHFVKVSGARVRVECNEEDARILCLPIILICRIVSW